MNNHTPSYRGYRFPPEIISHAVWLYHRFCLSFRDVEDLLAERGIMVTYETIRLWCLKFGPKYARTLKGRQGRLGDTWHLDELFVTIQGQRQYLWRAVDQDGDVIDILLQPTGPSCPQSPTSRPGSGSEACGGSNPWLKRNGSCRCMGSPRISSVSDAICCEQPTTECCGLVPSLLGTR